MAVSINWEFFLWVPLLYQAYSLGSTLRTPEFWKLPHGAGLQALHPPLLPEPGSPSRK